MSTLLNDVLEMLNDDLVSHGFLAQYLKRAHEEGAGSEPPIGAVLEELLASGMVEIGNTRLASPSHLEFVAWRGSVAERVARAFDAVAAAPGDDKLFAYWLCLPKNVDRCEV